MTDEEKQQRNEAFAKWEGWQEYDIPHPSRPGIEWMDADGRWKADLPDYETSAEARERLMEKAVKEGNNIAFWQEHDGACCHIEFEDEDWKEAKADTLAEAFLAALYAALQSQA